MQILDGKQLAEQIEDRLKSAVAEFTSKTQITPCLAAVLVGDDPASDVYVRSKRRACKRIGMQSRLHRLPSSTTEEELLNLVDRCNRDPRVHGILVQLPLPSGISTSRVLDAVHPLKDVDAFHPENVGRLVQGRPRFLPCTPHGVWQMLHHYNITTAGKHVVVVGRSDIVGKPIASLLSQRTSPWGEDFANATVTICHTHTRPLADFTRQADILIAAVGKPNCIQREMVKPGAVVIDVGVNRTDAGLVGDVNFEAVKSVAGYLTPVPGGVGPLTIVMLLTNTLQTAESRERRAES